MIIKEFYLLYDTAEELYVSNLVDDAVRMVTDPYHAQWLTRAGLYTLKKSYDNELSENLKDEFSSMNDSGIKLLLLCTELIRVNPNIIIVPLLQEPFRPDFINSFPIKEI